MNRSRDRLEADRRRDRRRDVDRADVPPGWKRCANPACRRVKPLEEFRKASNKRDGHTTRCRVCLRAEASVYRERGGRVAADERYAHSAARREAVKRRLDSRDYQAYQAEYRASDRFRLLSGGRRCRFLAKHAPTPEGRAAWAAHADLYAACAACLDPDAGLPVPPGARRCPGCRVPKPLSGGFYVVHGAPDGFSPYCRRCKPRPNAEHKRAREGARKRTARAKILASIATATKRLAADQRPRDRARTEELVRQCRAELARMDSVSPPRRAQGRVHANASRPQH